MRIKSAGSCALVLMLTCLVASAAGAATTLVEVTSSPDIAISVDSGSLLVEPEDAVVDDGVTPVLANLGSLPGGVDVVGYHLLWGPGEQLFCLDVPAELGDPGQVTVEPRDVVLLLEDHDTYSVEFDGSAAGVPLGAGIDAISVADDGDLLLSFDTTVSLPGGTFDPEDLVRFDEGGGTFSSFFDGSAAGVPAGLSLDAAHYLIGADTLLVSFDGSGVVSTVAFDDEDVLEYDRVGLTWDLAVDTDASEAAWTPANLSALFAIPDGDSDSDGLSDLDELRTHGTNPDDADTDDDGLDDGYEVTANPYTSDPNDTDTDDDGLDDGAEDSLGTDPGNPDHDADGICDGGGTGGGACTAGADNCPFVGNPGQEDSDYAPAGDACQCGDIDGDSYVFSSDLAMAREHLMGKAIPGDITYCNVVGDYAPAGDGSDCDVADIALLTRFIAGEPVTLGNVCKPYFEGP
jgi:hypothetical protein